VAELVTSGALRLTTGLPGSSFPLAEAHVEAQLLIELQEHSIAALEDAMDKLAVLLENYATEPVLLAETAREKESLRRLRLSIGQALTANGTWYRDVDMAVPLSALLSFIKKAEAICEEQDVRMICFGHVLDGNLHMMLLANQGAHVLTMEKLELAAAAIYHSGISMGGTISGEHGIGLLQLKYLSLQFSETHLKLMKGIKSLFDPNGILNPGKVF
jgi:glycolate oxidase